MHTSSRSHEGGGTRNLCGRGGVWLGTDGGQSRVSRVQGWYGGTCASYSRQTLSSGAGRRWEHRDGRVAYRVALGTWPLGASVRRSLNPGTALQRCIMGGDGQPRTGYSMYEYGNRPQWEANLWKWKLLRVCLLIILHTTHEYYSVRGGGERGGISIHGYLGH